MCNASEKRPRVATGKQAALLLDAGHYLFLDALMRRPWGAAELARELGWPLARTHYLLGRFEKAGLAQVMGQVRRSGRPIKRYGVAPEWFVPFEVTSAETLLALTDGMMQPLMRRFLQLMLGHLEPQRAGWQVRLRREEGALGIHILDDQGREPFDERALYASWGGLRVLPERAVELRDELLAVLRRFEAPAGANARTYSLGLFLVEGELH